MLISKFCYTAALAALLVVGGSQTCWAHFAWLATDDAGHALLFFGESPAERDYHLPLALEQANVSHHSATGKASGVKLELVDSKEFVGRRGAAPAAKSGELCASVVYGVYHGALLTYYTLHDLSLSEATKPAAGEIRQPLRANLSKTDDGGLQVQVMWQDEPLRQAEVKLYCEEGHEEAAVQTDAQGVAKFAAAVVEPGLNGLLVGYTDKQAAGEHEGQKYSSAMHYLTATFRQKAAAARPASESHPPAGAETTNLPQLPEGIASFGAAVSKGWLYVYSGHIGTAHDHSRENLSTHFRRLKINGPNEWEELPAGPPLQGLPLVARNDKLYRVGGLDARNASDEADDLHSTDSFARFDPQTETWKDLPPLPERRSSHDAVVIGDKLYVVGGWTLSGSDQGEWLDTAWVCDLSQAAKVWRAVAAPPFHRRAVAAAHWEGKLIVMGGLDAERNVSQSVDALDLSTGKWSTLPPFPSTGGGGHSAAGFGVSAWNLDGDLYASGMEGTLYRLSTTGADRTSTEGTSAGSASAEWTEVASLREPRFFHRLLPAGANGLIAVGGASPEEGHLKSIERINLPRR